MKNINSKKQNINIIRLLQWTQLMNALFMPFLMVSILATVLAWQHDFEFENTVAAIISYAILLIIIIIKIKVGHDFEKWSESILEQSKDQHRQSEEKNNAV